MCIHISYIFFTYTEAQGDFRGSCITSELQQHIRLRCAAGGSDQDVEQQVDGLGVHVLLPADEITAYPAFTAIGAVIRVDMHPLSDPKNSEGKRAWFENQKQAPTLNPIPTRKPRNPEPSVASRKPI